MRKKSTLSDDAIIDIFVWLVFPRTELQHKDRREHEHHRKGEHVHHHKGEHEHHRKEEHKNRPYTDRHNERPELKDVYQKYNEHRAGDRQERKDHLQPRKYYSPYKLHERGGGERPPRHRYDYHNAPHHGEYDPYIRHAPKRDFDRARKHEPRGAPDDVINDYSKSPNRKYFQFEDRRGNREPQENAKDKHRHYDKVVKAYDRRTPDIARGNKDDKLQDKLTK